jgi:hypothetical protein
MFVDVRWVGFHPPFALSYFALAVGHIEISVVSLLALQSTRIVLSFLLSINKSFSFWD